MIRLAPSILAADFARLGDEIRRVDQAGAEYIHLDVMDGNFVPSISFGMPVIQSIRKITNRILDVHMMTEKPERYIAAMKEAGADILCVHQEACIHLDRTISQIQEAGMKAAVALNPATDLDTISYVLPRLDMVLLMSVNPGFGGQKYIPYVTEKIRRLKARCLEQNLETSIEVDGGIGLSNVQAVIEAGADVIVAGSAVFQGDSEKNVKAFYELFQKEVS